MPKIGAHVSASVSLDSAFDKSQTIGAESFQIFITPPQRWAFTLHRDVEIENFKKKASKTLIGPNFIHGSYLINLGTDNPDHLQKSIQWLNYAMTIAQKLGIEGVIFHTGSHKGRGIETVMNQIVLSITEVLNRSNPEFKNLTQEKSSKNLIENPKLPYLILETSAGAGGGIGKNFTELGTILKRVQNNRLKICIDTAHTFASGYDWRTKTDQILDEFDQKIGLEHLTAIHANDSKMDINTNKDRHANIGEGFLGLKTFRILLNHPKLQGVPFLLEVPGFAEQGPDKENIDILKNLRDKII